MFKVAILQKRSINEQIDKNIETIIMAMEEASIVVQLSRQKSKLFIMN